MARKQDIDVGVIAFTGLVGALLLLIIIWGVEGWYHYEVNLLTDRHSNIGQNVSLNDLKLEQYGNLGDTVGNDIVYASEIDALGDAASPAFGYRWTDQSRQSAGIPIHAAMARIVRQTTGQDVTVEQMRTADAEFVRIVNEAHGDVMTPTEVEPQAPRVPEPSQAESAAEPNP